MPANNKLCRKLLSGVLAGVLFVMPVCSAAQTDGTVSGDKATDMVVDVVVMRPLGLAATIVGVVALPFTIPSGSVEASARELIVKPAEYTFQRPLGDFSGNAD